MKELFVVSLLKDNEVRQAFQADLQMWMFDQDLARTAIKVLLDLRTYQEGAFKANLSVHLSESEIDGIMKIMNAVKTPIVGDEREVARDQLIDFIREKSVAKAIHKASTEGLNEEVYAELADAVNVSIIDEKIFDFTDPEDVARAKLDMFPQGGFKVIKSSFGFINNALMMEGYTPGTVNMFVAKPGLGKTTAMIQEGLVSLVQGYRVFHMFLGDMGAYDAISKYICCRKGLFINNAIRELENHIDDDMKSLLGRLRVSIHGAYELNADKLAALARSTYRTNPFDVIIIDYDGNIAPVAGDNMYEAGGYTYARIEKMAKDLGIVVLIGCQTKIGFWDYEVPPMEGAADSSKKQQVVDMMVTFGKSNSLSPVGTGHVAKNRRGEVGVKCHVFFEGSKARIREIGEAEYSQHCTSPNSSKGKFQK